MRTRALRDVSIRELRGLLDEESAAWRSELAWDFSDVRAAVAAGVERGTLPGRAVSDGGRAHAYCYYMVDAGRVIIGSIYAGREQRGRGLEDALVEAVISDARAERGSSRVECQTLFCTSDTAEGRFAAAGFAGGPRHYMRRDLRQPLPPAEPALPRGVCLRPLGRDELQTAAEIVYRSHVGSVDAALNLTYATPAACRAFVDTLVLRSGCGRFDDQASRLAEGPRGPVGVLIASRLSEANGHVCQVSVAPDAQGRGIGAALMAVALHAFRVQGLASATLSVTVSNRRAHRLYELLGYRVHRRFAAHAWVRPPARIELPA
ncbi:MAG TPA: GNAT family N-acetyltransferase [Vicinamibacteria bacterium]|nr:GNAT family N-acetyltransferase [Vicinamibacteria bacterium]